MKNVILLAIFFVSICPLLSCSEETSDTDPQRDRSSGNQDENTNDVGADENNENNENGENDENSNDEDESVADDDDSVGDDDDESEPQTGKVKDNDTEICNSIDLNLEAAPVRIMILQDLSSSMREGNPTKWTQAKAALTTMLESFNDVVDFGFDGFPNAVQCGVSQPPYSDTMRDNKDNIIKHINSIAPTVSTPLYKAMQNYQNADYAPKFLSMGATRYLLIVSDGIDTCGQGGGSVMGMMGVGAPALGELTTKLCEEMGVNSYVIGFGGQASPQQLNAIAKAGGTNVDTYFNAQNEAELEKALNEIVATTVSCVYDIGEQDEEEIDLDKVNFYFDSKVVGLDKNCGKGSGWTWVNKKRTKVEFCEKSCNKLKKQKVKEVTATFGCPTEIVQIY